MTETLIFPRVIDATMRSDWRACPHKFFRRHVCGLTKDRQNVHLHFGRCVAHGLEVARRGFYEHHDPKDALVDGCEAVIAAWGDFEPVEPLTRAERNKTLSNCLLALQAYFREWPLEEDDVQIHTHNDKPCVEFSFALPVPGSHHPDGPDANGDDHVLYGGRFDMIGDYQHSTWGLDDKTTGADPSSDSWRNQWRLRGQFSGYTWAAREYGMPLRGFLVRGLGVLKDFVRCAQVIVPRPDWMVDRWLAQLCADVTVMCAQYNDLRSRRDGDDYGDAHSDAHSFAQSFDNACSDFGGCPYLDLCASQSPDAWLSEYVVSRWDPLGVQS